MNQNETHQQILWAATWGRFDAAIIKTFEIHFDPVYRRFCQENLCGRYGKSYSCPPYCGSPQELKDQIMARDHAMVMRWEYDLPAPDDLVGMYLLTWRHNQRLRRVVRRIREDTGVTGILVGGGPCEGCKPCGKYFDVGCNWPQERISSFNAYCIHVEDLCRNADMRFMPSRPDKIALFGLFVW